MANGRTDTPDCPSPRTCTNCRCSSQSDSPSWGGRTPHFVWTVYPTAISEVKPHASHCCVDSAKAAGCCHRSHAKRNGRSSKDHRGRAFRSARNHTFLGWRGWWWRRVRADHHVDPRQRRETWNVEISPKIISIRTLEHLLTFIYTFTYTRCEPFKTIKKLNRKELVWFMLKVLRCPRLARTRTVLDFVAYPRVLAKFWK